MTAKIKGKPLGEIDVKRNESVNMGCECGEDWLVAVCTTDLSDQYMSYPQMNRMYLPGVQVLDKCECGKVRLVVKLELAK